MLDQVYHPIVVVYSEIDLRNNQKAQSGILSYREIDQLISESQKTIETKSQVSLEMNELRSELTPRQSISQSGPLTLTQWIVPLFNEHLEEMRNMPNSALITGPLSMAKNHVKSKDHLKAPAYLSQAYIERQFNQLDFYDIMGTIKDKLALTSNKEYLIIDKKVIETRRSIIGDVLKKFTKAILTGKPIASVSIPIKVMEPMSQTATFARMLANLEQLRLASLQSDPLETFKRVICYACSNIYFGVNYIKPITPLIGETAQGYFADGSKYYAEKLSHHPLALAFQVVNDIHNFEVDVKFEMDFKMTANEFKSAFKGIIHVRVKEHHFYYTMPIVWSKGLMYGKNVFGFDHYFYFHFPGQKMKAWVKVNSNGRADLLDGCILDSKENLIKNYDKFASNIFPGMKPKKTDPAKQLALISGAFTERIMIDDIESWNCDQLAYKMKMCEDVLPSDWRFREDLIWYLNGDIVMAENWKVKLEEVQREFKKLKDSGDKVRLKKAKSMKA